MTVQAEVALQNIRPVSDLVPHMEDIGPTYWSRSESKRSVSMWFVLFTIL